MKQTIEKAVKMLSEQITKETKSEDALRFTQAALNLAQVLRIQADISNNSQIDWRNK
jgi:hypothetical protein